MNRSRFTRILPLALILIIVVIAIAALVSLARVVFFSGGSTSTPATVDTSRQALLDTTVTHSVQMTVRGPIVADEDFHSYTITITPNSRDLTTYTGYLNTKVDETTLTNNVKAYGEFVNALDKANLTKGTAFTGDKNDLSGICATGEVTDFQILDGTNVVKDLWTSTCNGSKGSLDASVSQVGDLFINQFPNATATIKKTDL